MVVTAVNVAAITFIPTLFCVIYWKCCRHRQTEHIYACVDHVTPPQLPPRPVTTQENPAYVQVELTDCVAYTSDLPGKSSLYDQLAACQESEVQRCEMSRDEASHDMAEKQVSEEEPDYF